jgi:hypothetical protein
MGLSKFPQINPLKDLVPREVAEVVDTLRDQARPTYDNEEATIVVGEKRVVLKDIVFSKEDLTNEKTLDIHEHLRFGDFGNVALSWTQKGGSKSYVPRIIAASPNRFKIKIDDHPGEDVTFSRIEFKGV